MEVELRSYELWTRVRVDRATTSGQYSRLVRVDIQYEYPKKYALLFPVWEKGGKTEYGAPLAFGVYQLPVIIRGVPERIALRPEWLERELANHFSMDTIIEVGNAIFTAVNRLINTPIRLS